MIKHSVVYSECEKIHHSYYRPEINLFVKKVCSIHRQAQQKQVLRVRLHNTIFWLTEKKNRHCNNT